MNLKSEMLRDHSKVQANKIVRWVGNDSKRFKALVDTFLKGPYRVTQRASWPLAYCVEYHPKLVAPHLVKLINFLKTPGNHDSVKRNILRFLQHIDIPKRQHGIVIDLCFAFLTDPKEPIAVRVFSMAVLAQLVKVHRELKQELRIIIEDHLPYATPAFTSRAKKVLKQLNQSSS
jgi:hypothetical protein